MKAMRVMKKGEHRVKYYPISSDDLLEFKKVNGSWKIVNKGEGTTIGFIDGDRRKVIKDENCEIFEEVNFEILKVEKNYYRYGGDKVLVKVNNRKVTMIANKWSDYLNYYYNPLC